MTWRLGPEARFQIVAGIEVDVEALFRTGLIQDREPAMFIPLNDGVRPLWASRRGIDAKKEQAAGRQ